MLVAVGLGGSSARAAKTSRSNCGGWLLWGLVAPVLGRLKSDVAGSSHMGHPGFLLFTFLLTPGNR